MNHNTVLLVLGVLACSETPETQPTPLAELHPIHTETRLRAPRQPGPSNPSASYVDATFAPNAGGSLSTYVVAAGDASPWAIKATGPNRTGPLYHYSNDLPGPRTWNPELGFGANVSSVAVSPEGNPWIVDAAGHVFAGSCNTLSLPITCTWTAKQPAFTAWELGVGAIDGANGPDSEAWAISRNCATSGGPNPHPTDCAIFKWNFSTSTWQAEPGLTVSMARHIAVSPEGNVYVTDSAGGIHKRIGGDYPQWPAPPTSPVCASNAANGDWLGTPVIGAASHDSVWVVGGQTCGQTSMVLATSNQESQWSVAVSSSFGSSISLSADGTPWVVDTSQLVWEYVSAWQPIGPNGYSESFATGTAIWSGRLYDIDTNGLLSVAAVAGGVWATPTSPIAWVPVGDVGAGYTGAGTQAPAGPSQAASSIARHPTTAATMVVGTGNIDDEALPGNGIWISYDATAAQPAWLQVIDSSTGAAVVGDTVKVRFSSDGSVLYAATTTQLFVGSTASTCNSVAVTCILTPIACADLRNDPHGNVNTDMVVDPTNANDVYLGVAGKGLTRIINALRAPACSTAAPTLFSGTPDTITSVSLATQGALAPSGVATVYASFAGNCTEKVCHSDADCNDQGDFSHCTANICVNGSGAGTCPQPCQGSGDDFEGVFATNSAAWPFPTFAQLIGVNPGEQAFLNSQNAAGWNPSGMCDIAKGRAHNWALGVSPDGSTLLVAGRKVWRATGCNISGCTGFAVVPDDQFIHEDVHAFGWAPSGLVLVVTDGGINSSTDNGATWSNALNTLGVANEISVTALQGNDTQIAAAAWDAGGHFTLNGGATWQSVGQPADDDTTLVAVDSSQPDRFYLCTADGKRVSSAGGVLPWTEIDNSGISTAGGRLNCDMTVDYIHGILYGVSTDGTNSSHNALWSSTNGGSSWSQVAAISDLWYVNANNNPTQPNLYISQFALEGGFYGSGLSVSLNGAPFESLVMPPEWGVTNFTISSGNWPSVSTDVRSGDFYMAGQSTSPGVADSVFRFRRDSTSLTTRMTGNLTVRDTPQAISVDSQFNESDWPDTTPQSVIVAVVNQATHGFTSVVRLNNPDAKDPLNHWRPWVHGLPNASVDTTFLTFGRGANSGRIEYFYYAALYGRGIWKREARGGDF